MTLVFSLFILVSESAASIENEIMNLMSFFGSTIVKMMAQLDSPKGELTASQFDDVMALLLLIEQLHGAVHSNENLQKQLNHALSQIPEFAKSSSLLLEHMNDKGKNNYG